MFTCLAGSLGWWGECRLGGFGVSYLHHGKRIVVLCGHILVFLMLRIPWYLLAGAHFPVLNRDHLRFKVDSKILQSTIIYGFIVQWCCRPKI
ncbi:hypothetical protein OIU79_011377 [Salix purpurea]|uniref:Uncharacterized protein n=1 Tax=Salix purpurea TaxID=77065 RepID=A0A9Q0Q0Z8_SALPP|nr:hypothetical protein OIU79_011377 [Salix purpurea]